MNRLSLIILHIAALKFSFSFITHNKLMSQEIDDLYLNFTQLTEKYGYPTEQHSVITEDGYILGLHRILSKCPSTVGYPIILMHGLFDSSDAWIVTGPNEGMAYVLADNCYDVWAANNRGNTYSRKHLRLNPDKDLQFWEYSFDENGIYDLPAIIDYVIDKANNKRVYYIGHSQGTTNFFAMATLKPEYNNKIQLSIHLAPVAIWKYVGPVLNFATSRRELLVDIFKNLGLNEIFAKHQVVRQMAIILCQLKPEEACGTILNLLTGETIGKLSPKRIMAGIAHLFAGGSARSLDHYAQVIQSQKFQRFDEGKHRNRRRYGIDHPPEYNLSLVTSPVVLMCGRNDRLSDLRNVGILSRKLPNLLEVYIVSDPTWSHNDYLWSETAVKYVIPKILEYFNAYNNL